MSVNHMRFGIFLAPFHPNNENPTLAIDRDMALVQHLDTLDYDEAWIGEHHSGGFEIISSPEIFCAAAAQVTKHIKLGSGVISLPYHNPFMIANRVTQLDHMTRGRFMFGFGPGALAGDAYRMGVDPEQSRRMMHEAIDVIMPLLRGEMVNAEDRLVQDAGRTPAIAGVHRRRAGSRRRLQPLPNRRAGRWPAWHRHASPSVAPRTPRWKPIRRTGPLARKLRRRMAKPSPEITGAWSR